MDNDNLFSSNQGQYKHNDRYCNTIPNNKIKAANKYLLVHNHQKHEFAPYYHNNYNSSNRNNTYNNKFNNTNNNTQSKLSFYGFQSLQSMPKLTKYRYNFDEDARANFFNKKRNDFKLQIIEERINNLESRNAQLEQSNNVFFTVFNEVVKSNVYKHKYITRNMNKFKDKDQEKIKEMLQFANDPNNEFDAEGRVLEYKIPGILSQIKQDIAKLIAENVINNGNTAQVFHQSIKALQRDLYKDIDNISNKQKENLSLLKEFVTYNSTNKELAKRMIDMQSKDNYNQSLNASLSLSPTPTPSMSKDASNENKDNDAMIQQLQNQKEVNIDDNKVKVVKRRRKKGKTISQLK